MGAACTTQIKAEEQDRISLILLGCPAVGKSTVFKQLTLLYHEGFKESTRKGLRKHVLSVLLETQAAVKELITQSRKAQGGAITNRSDATSDSPIVYSAEADGEDRSQGLTDRISFIRSKIRLLVSAEDEEAHHDVDEQNELEVQGPLQDLVAYSELPDVRAALSQLFASDRDDLTNKYYQRLPDSAKYFQDRLPEIAHLAEYIPSDEDILRLRRVTTECARVEFVTKMTWPPNSAQPRPVPISCTDVGGQSQHEFEWVKYGSQATAVLFVMCLSDFNETGESGSNKLKDSLGLLRRIASAPSFQRKQFVILFNKSDLLEEKLARNKVRDFFTSYDGDNSPGDVVDYFEERVRLLVENTVRAKLGPMEDVQVSVVQTCAVNSRLMQEVLTRVLLGLFQSILRHVWS